MKEILKKISLVAIAFSFLTACSPKIKNIEKKITKLEIKSPIPELNLVFEEFDIDNTKDEIIKTKMGSSIKIPANSIVDKEGNPVSNFKLKYREFHDAVDIFLSGIPMDYRSQGQKRNMQTAGMFEIRAFDGEKELFIADGKKVDVQMASFEAGTDYSFFHLDEYAKGWEFIDYNDRIEINANKEKLKKEIQKKAPSMPFPLDDKYFAFDYSAILDVVFNNDYYKIRENRDNPAISAKAKKYGLMWINSRSWENITFKGVDYPATMMVWKKIYGNRFPAWMKDGDKDHITLKLTGRDIYSLNVESNDGTKTYSATIECVMPIAQLFKFAPEYWKKNYQDAMAKVEKEMERLKMEADVYRSFEIAGFGIYNYDKLMKEDDAVKVIANFVPEEAVLKNNENYEMDVVYYVPGDNKTLIKLPKEDWGKLNLIPGDKGRFLSVLPGSAIGIYTAEKFMELNFEKLRKEDNPKLNFTLVQSTQKASSAEDIRNFLNF